MQRTFHGIDIYAEGSEILPSPADVRKRLYAEIADPLFFKFQRGEATKYEWLQMIKKIKDTYPDE